LREDWRLVAPDRSTSVKVSIGGRELAISNLDKVMYPRTGFTKGEVIDYYTRIAPAILPHLRNRPLTMKRYPNGVDGQTFFEKRVPVHAPDWLERVRVPISPEGTWIEYGMLNDIPDLVWAANLATIELHVPLWRAGATSDPPGPPDTMVFDLDPGEGTTVVECCQVALIITELLGARGLQPYPKTSGSKGLHLYVPVAEDATWETVRGDAHQIAEQLERDHPALVLSTMRKSLRAGKVFIDWSQNHPAKTTVAPYSLRARPEPTVSTPISWDEVARCADESDPGLLTFTAPVVLDRVDKLGDLFAPLDQPG
jgi:bifunctional non-homologous end joining protein LigD